MNLAIPEALQADLRAIGRSEGHTLEQEARIALQYYVAHQHNQGELQHPEDVMQEGLW